MPNGRDAIQIKRVRNEVLVALKMLYPAAIQAEPLFRSILGVFCDLEWDQFRRDLAYLTEKGYLVRVVADGEPDDNLTPWRRRWFRLTHRGVEIADHVIGDPALDE